MVQFHLFLLLSSMDLQVELFQLVHLFAHGLALVPLLKAHFVVLPTVAQEVFLDLASVFKLKLVVAELEINQRVVLFKAVTELHTDICRKLVVSNIKHQQ